MDLYCTRPGCSKPVNTWQDLDNPTAFKTVQQKYCTNCGMPLFLLGRYLPQKLLGQGGFGAAFLARDRYTPGLRPCVVKQFQPSVSLTANQLKLAQQLFEREAEVLESLGTEHPQIPDLYAFFDLSIPSPQTGKTDQFFYLVQEFIDGQTMEEELAQTGPFSEAAILELLQSILPVLAFVHQHGSIHRDIKPSNIMRHKKGRLYLLDFGAVKQATKGGSASRSTGIFSQGFAPPEQVSGAQVYPSSDLYALAVTCIMLLTGKDPTSLYDSYSNTWKWEQHAQVSSHLRQILNRMLMPSASDRFQSAEQVLAALQTPARRGRSPSLSSSPAPRSPSPPTSPPSANQPLVRPPAQPPLSTLELLRGAALTGFEAGLLAIALLSLLGTALGSGFWLLLLGVLWFLQWRRIVDWKDVLILSAITLAILTLLPVLRQLSLGAGAFFLPVSQVIFIAVMVGLAAIAVTALFKLIYNLVSKIL